MPSSISWLDFSHAEQTRMRELLRSFSDSQAMDELGLGQIRDAMGNGLFPGTSTLHTRARYFLFVPWIYQMVSASASNRTLHRARMLETQLIEALRVEDDREGVIGIEAGTNVKQLPSAVYWSALRRFGILTAPDLSREQAVAYRPGQFSVDAGDGMEESPTHVWRPTIPPPPARFPRECEGGLKLTAQEAGWLQECIAGEVPESLLAHFLYNEPDVRSSVPWLDSASGTISSEQRALLDHARLFSTVMHGARILYFLLASQSQLEKGLVSSDESVTRMSAELNEWFDGLDIDGDIATWDLDDFFLHVTNIRQLPLANRTKEFVREWLSLLVERHVSGETVSPQARDLITTREAQHKGGLARIGNEQRLRNWSPPGVVAAYNYRWSTVRTILKDIHVGLEAESTGSTESGEMS